jgi:hypothetical protein
VSLCNVFVFYHTKAGVSILNAARLLYTHISRIFCICALLDTETLRGAEPYDFAFRFNPPSYLFCPHVVIMFTCFSEQTEIMPPNSMYTLVTIMEMQAVI